MKRYLGCLLAVLLLAGCSGQQAAPATESVAGSSAKPSSITVFAMDTVMELAAYGGSDALMQEAEQRILDLEALLSVTDENSEIYALNRDGKALLSADTEGLMEQALEMCHRTNGALDISIYPVLRAWGFTTGTYQIPDSGELTALLASVDYSRISVQDGAASIPAGMEIDLGSVAKGYTGDEVTQLLRENGVTSALLNLGGNVQVIGGKPDGSNWRVAVQDPESSGYLGVLELRDKAAITSGGYERYFVGEDGTVYWHIIDPATGCPAHSGLISVTVIGDSGTACDALSTALFVMGLEKAADYWRQYRDFDAIFVSEDGSVSITAGLQDCFSLTDEYADRPLKVIA